MLKKATFFRTFRNPMRKINSALVVATFLREITVFTRFDFDVLRNTNSTVVLSLDRLEGQKEHKFHFNAPTSRDRIQRTGFVVSIFAVWLALGFSGFGVASSSGFVNSHGFVNSPSVEILPIAGSSVSLHSSVAVSTSSNALIPTPQDDVELINRIWTDNKAQQVRGIFRARIAGVVKIENTDGEVTSMPFSSLVEGDQEYVEAVIAKFGSAPNTRTWSDTSGNNFRGAYKKLNKSEVEFLLIDDDKRMNIETIFLTAQDIDYLIEKINSETTAPVNRDRSYRVWRFYDANSNALRCIGQYKKVVGKNLVLNQVDSEYRIPLSQLDSNEINYLQQIDPSLRGKINSRSGENFAETRNETAAAEKRQLTIESARVQPIWWISIGIVFLLLLALIAIRYIYESSAPEWDDD